MEVVQSCALPPSCPPDGLDPATCLSEALPFTPTFFEEEVVSVAVDPGAVAALALAPGEYWAAFSDGVSCDRVVVTVTVPEVTP